MIDLNIGQINIRSINCNIDLLRGEVANNNLDIIILQETWLKNDNFNFGIKLRLEASNRQDGYGGVAIAIKSNLIYDRIILLDLSPIEIIMIKVKYQNSYIHLISLYIPPNISITIIKNKLDILNNFLLNYDNLIVAGDFNASDYLWDKHCSSSSNRTDTILNFINVNNLVILNTGEPTNIHYKRHSAIDLSLVSANLFNNWSWHVLDEDCGSNHKLIVMKPKKISCGPKLVTLFNKKRAIEEINKLNFENFTNLEECIANCTNCVNNNISTKASKRKNR